LYILFSLSGAAALGYQLVWSKMFLSGLGHEMPAVLAIICAFMGGMALGSFGIDRFIPRHVRAGRWLGGLELMIGVWAVAVGFLIPHVNEIALRLTGLAPGGLRHWTIAFVLPALTLLPATAAIGATFPAMEKLVSALAPEDSSIGSVYAANTFGAVAGVLLAPFVLMPVLGLTRSCWLLALLNSVVAIGAFAMSRVWSKPGRSADSPVSLVRATRQPIDAPAPGEVPELGNSAVRAPISASRLAATLFVTGLLGIGYETAGVRVLSQVLKNTVFTYAAVLAVFLLGTAAGGAAYHRWWRNQEPRRLLATLLCGTALACFAGMLLMSRAPWLYQTLRQMGDSRMAVLIAELGTAVAAFALPTFCMGATFSHVVQLARAARGHVGKAVALNTIGAAVAPAVCGVILIPLMGTKSTLLLLGVGFALLLPAKPSLKVAVPCLIACAWALFINLGIVSVPSGGRVIEYREGVMGSVAVIDEGNNRILRVDNSYQMGGTGSADAEYRQAHIPLLLHPKPGRALFLGVGTGISFGAASLYPDLKADGVELVPEVVEAMRLFQPANFSPEQQPNLKLHIADARRFVRVSGESYDVVVADLFHPYRDGAAALYTREHFAAVRQRLAPGGLFCQWLPLHQLDEPTLRVIVHTFATVFPDAEAWLLRFNVDVPVMALVGGIEAQRYSADWIGNRGGAPRLAGELKRLALADSVRLLGHRLATPEELRAFAANAPLNTDQNPRVSFMAPRLAYQRDAKPYATLLTLLASAKSDASALADDASLARRVSLYVGARNVYLRGLIHDVENRRAEAVDAYIESARLSSDFTSGYAQCLRLAAVISESEPARAKKILERLAEAQPDNPVAKDLLQRLFQR
jgi:spermidine synthase